MRSAMSSTEASIFDARRPCSDLTIIMAVFCHRVSAKPRIAASMSSTDKLQLQRLYLHLAIDDSAAEMPFSENT